MRVVDKVAADRRRKNRRRAKCLAAAVAAVPLLALPAVSTAGASAAAVVQSPVFDALLPSPARVLTLSLIAGGNDDDLRGVVCEQRTCVPVPYPYLDRKTGVIDFDNGLHANGSPGRQIGYGYSQGARVMSDWLNSYAGTEGAPTPEELSFVLIGNPGRKHGGSRVHLNEMTPDTDYRVLDVSRQYDLASDTPDDRTNLLAMMNAYAGFSSIHPDYESVDIYDSANYVWTEGNTTYVFVPTARLPILGFLYSIGLSGLADSLDAPLRAAIEKAYDRSYLPAKPGLPQAEAEPEPASVEPETEQAPVAAALQVSRKAQAPVDTDAASVVPGSEDSQEVSEPEAEGVDSDASLAEADLADADLADDATELSGDLDEDTVEPEADEDQAAVTTASATADSDSADSDSADPSSSADSPSSDNDTAASNQSSSDNDE